MVKKSLKGEGLKTKGNNNGAALKLKRQVVRKTETKKQRDSIFEFSPIYDLLRNFKKAPNQWTARYIIILSAVILRGVIGLGSFLGEGEKPINGDFEAQRHWMELTLNIPISEWYFFDLEYWGLDYPPLTAYHLLLLGKIGSLINPSWFALNESRGYEGSDLKTFMRLSSIASELIIYVPALLSIISVIGKNLNVGRMDQIIFSSILFYLPPLSLIDHGHFQYNSVMLGLFLLSFGELVKKNLILASIWFILSINFKQMALYYAPFIFVYILSNLFERPVSVKYPWTTFNFKNLILISITIVITQVAVLWPFIMNSPTYEDALIMIRQILFRVFPFQRGLFEDKVGNFWCVSNLLIKYRDIFSLNQLTKLSLATTLISLAPPCLMVFYKGLFQKDFNDQKRLLSLIYGFAATAWSFYMFSFQVHEKSVLVPLLPSSLLYLLNDKNYVSIIQWINNSATFSLYPLLKKDHLILQYAVSLLLSNWFIGGFNIKANMLIPSSNIFWKLIVIGSYISMLFYHVIDIYIPPPSSYPDLWVIVNATISFSCFGIFWLWLLYKIYKI